MWGNLSSDIFMRRYHQRRTIIAGILSLLTIALLAWWPAPVRAAADGGNGTALTQSIIGTQRLMVGAASQNQITIGSNQSQDFFSPSGSTVIDSDADGNWSNITLTNINDGGGYNQVGAVTLNMRIDMNYDFTFHWQVKTQPALDDNGNPRIMADGIGFALHPVYNAGVTGTGPDSEISSDQTIDQGLHAVGNNGGNLGTADLMNSWGFKLDSYYNDGFSGPLANTFYGDVQHRQNGQNGGTMNADAYATADNRVDGSAVDGIPVDNLGGQWGPYGMFTQTDATGYMSYTASDNSIEQTPLTGKAANSVNMLAGQWENMTMSYDATFHQLKVQITDPTDTSRTMTWERALTAAEQANIQSKKYYAFSVLGSTGTSVATQAIQHLGGTFTPENPTLVVRQTTTNGTSIADAQTITTKGTVKTQAPVQATPTDKNNQFQGILSHILFTYYDSTGHQVTKRVDNTRKNGFDRDVDNWFYSVNTNNYSALTMVTYVYRRQNDLPQLTFKYDNVTTDSDGNATLTPGSDVRVTATLTNPASGPSTWMDAFALDKLPAMLQLKEPTSNVTTQADGWTKIKFGDIARGTPAQQVFTLHYQGTMNATLYPGSIPSNAGGLVLAQDAYVYDASPENKDTAGNPVSSSYYYVPNVLDAPLKTETATAELVVSDYTEMDYGNFVPYYGSKAPTASAAFHYWDVTDKNATTMDPAKTGHPTTDITGAPAKTVTGQLGDAITAPATALSGYDYLGYYEYTSTGSTWHAAGDTAPTFYFQSQTGATPQQTIAYVYRPTNSKYLTITPPKLDFGQHTTQTISQTNQTWPLSDAAQVQVADNRPHKDGVPTADGWQVTVQASGPFKTADGQTLTGASLAFTAPTTSTTPSPTLTGGTLTLGTGTSNTLTLAKTADYGSANLQWAADGVHLALPKQAVAAQPYTTTLTWTVNDGL
ncbi:lectin-like domain-containing protein [Schleiferilactobacillus shenzhenensis]|uniref:WxL domain-containing protein n=1 Tax=Schleiferilactobacillus shenzhenensis LY-73 TaxID=1231336 RepID=U4TU90_9LACO|nr:hypothetical protein [Schleiferilactobacillus shenzhenensis]ERL65007.1 hypothetical protein L248_3169 [Schleiferilactobacillus shenzhenensis LY-73]